MAVFRPLAGVRVLSFEVAVSLPAGTRILADFGAEVVQVRRPRPEEDAFIIVNFDGTLLNKESVALDLTRPGAREVALRLAAGADAVCTNFRPGVLERFGLDYAALREARADQIVLQLSGYGTPGPWARFPAFGHSVEAAAGMNALIGEPEDQPVQVGSRVLADQLAGKYAALALLGALLDRRRTRQGRYIDLSMYEAIVHTLGELVLATSAGGAPPRRTGNRDPNAAPQGIYPCLGPGGPWSEAQGRPSETSPGGPWSEAQGRPSETSDDEWVAVTVASDRDWVALRGIIRDPRLASAAFDSLQGRLRGHDEIDMVIAGWTRARRKEEAAALLQAEGIAAGPVQRPSDIALDPQHAHRGFFQQVRHEQPVLGYAAHPHQALAVLAEGYARPPLAESHLAGADSHRVLAEWAGYAEPEIAALERDGVLIAASDSSLLRPASPPKQGFGGRPGPVDTEFARKLALPRIDEVRP